MRLGPAPFDSLVEAERARECGEPREQRPRVADVVERVQVDAQDEPDTYLTETIVPGGGE